MKSSEEWRAIPGYPTYQISSWGNARSLDHVVRQISRWGEPYQRRMKGRRLRPGVDGAGYLTCYPFHRVHCAVLLAFVGPCPPGMEACHEDGNKLNNKLSNLVYDTHSRNVMDRVKHGTDNRGEKHKLSKLTRKNVIAILRDRYSTQIELGRQYGVTDSAIRMIKSGRRWGWLQCQ